MYESNGKDITPSELKDKPANGDATTNGTEDDKEKSLDDALKEDIPKIFCHICGNDCTRASFHNAKANPKFDVCPRCFREAKFGSNWLRADFVEMENKEYSIIPDRESKWEDTELLRLLEGLEQYDDDWSKIADYVGTRTREECVLKFLQLEIEDDYAEPDPRDKEDPSTALAYLGEGRVPFSKLYNPVLSTMAYLAGIADPKITAAAVGKSVQEIQRTIQTKIDNDTSDKGKGKATEGGAEKDSSTADDAMDVETSTALEVTKGSNEASQNPMVTLPFALTAARASALASHEERNLTRLVHTATNLQVQKLELKLQQFSEMENLIKLERKDLERRRQALFLERLEFQRRMKTVEDAFERAMTLGSPEALKAVQEVVRGSNSKGSLSVGKAKEADEVQPLGSGDSGFKKFDI